MLYHIIDSYLFKFKSSYNLIVSCVLFMYLVYNYVYNYRRTYTHTHTHTPTYTHNTHTHMYIYRDVIVIGIRKYARAEARNHRFCRFFF